MGTHAKVILLLALVTLALGGIATSGLTVQLRGVNYTENARYTPSPASTGDGSRQTPLVWKYQLHQDAFSPLVDISDDGSAIAAGGYSGDLMYLFGRNSSVPRWNQTCVPDELVVSDNGTYVVAASGGRVACYQGSTGAILMNYTASNGITSVDISGDGQYVVAGGSNISLFRRDNATPEWTYSTQTGVSVVRISDDGSTIVAGNYRGSTYLIDRANGALIWKTDIASAGSTPWITSCFTGISGDGNYVAVTGSEIDNVYLLSRESNMPLWNYTSPAGYGFGSIAISRDGNYVVAGDVIGDVYLFQKESGVPIWSYGIQPPEIPIGGYGIGVPVASIALSSNGSRIVASTYASKIYLFSRSSDTPLWIYDAGHYSSMVPYVAISADGEYVVAGGFSGWIYLLKVMDLTWMNAEPLPSSIVASLVVGAVFIAATAFTVVFRSRVKKRSSRSRKGPPLAK
jgi:WD40 repeat protein